MKRFVSSDAPPTQSDVANCPRGSLQRRVVLWTLGLVIAATFTSAFWLGDIARRSLTDSHVRTCELLAQTLAGAFAGSIEDSHWTRQADHVLDGLSLDPRVAFVAVTDPNSRTIYQHTFDPQAYAGFAEAALAYDGKYIEPEAPIELSDGSSVVARKTPIWNPPKGFDESAEGNQVRKLDGFVVLAMRDRRIGEAQTQMQAAQLVAAAMVCFISLPLVVWSVRRWTSPLLALVRATADLARGRKPRDVPPAGNDELGLLTSHFNDMAHRLVAAREQLQQANAHLEIKVQQRTVELQQVNRRLQSEMRDKEEFLRAVSHDLGAPLRNIAGLSDLLVRKHHDDLADDVLNKLQRITANAHQQTEMINDLLEISRICTRPGDKQMVEIDALLRQIADNLAYDLEQKGIELKIESPLPPVFAEKNRLRQVFQNLIDNAIKYMRDDGDKRITIRAEQTPTDVTFHVSDTGVGIDARDLDAVFQVFRRATHSGTHAIPGRGVGLASVKSIIQTHGGDITVQSTPGQGSTFSFTLPNTPSV